VPVGGSAIWKGYLRPALPVGGASPRDLRDEGGDKRTVLEWSCQGLLVLVVVVEMVVVVVVVVLMVVCWWVGSAGGGGDVNGGDSVKVGWWR
jgi:hypothetical protein